jgi:transposase
MSNSNITTARVQEAGQTLYAGVDLALKKNVVVILNQAGQVVDRFQFTQDREGYEYFEQRGERLRQREQASGIEVAMEPSNYLWKLLAQEMEEKQQVYRLVNAYTVKKHREGNQLDRSKDDWRDAREIGELARQGQCTQTRLQQGVYEELRQYATLYWQVTRAMRREKTIVCGLVGQVFPEFFHVFQKATSETAQAILQSGVAAVEIRQGSLDAFVAGVRAVYPGRRLQVTKLRRLYDRAATSIGVSQGVPAIQFALRLHLRILNTLEQQFQQLRTALQGCLSQVPEAAYLLSMPAVTPVTAALFFAEVGDPRRYHTAGQWVKLAGIQPVPNRSGRKQRSRTPMSHQGRPHLRTLLYYAALQLITRDPHFIQLYTHLQRRSTNPLTGMQALGVLMNKLLHVWWALIQQHAFYQPDFSPANAREARLTP